MKISPHFIRPPSSIPDGRRSAAATRLLITTACCWLQLACAAEIRLAIVPAETRSAVAGELLTAEFSRVEHGVAVLERAEVERIRREQNLTARSSADFARLGQALGAQGVLVLDVFEQNGVTNLVVKLLAVQSDARRASSVWEAGSMW